MLRAKVAACNWHAWWLKFGRIDQLEGAILGVSVEINQISDAPRLGCVVNIFLYLGEIKENRAFILPRIDAPIVNLNFHFLDRRAGVDRGLTSSYSRAG